MRARSAGFPPPRLVAFLVALVAGLTAPGCAPTGRAGDDSGDGDGAGPDGGFGPVPDARPPYDWPYDDPGADGAYKDPSLPDGIHEWFEGGETGAGAPDLVYPLDGAMHPMNLRNLAFHWRAGGAHTVYRVEIAGDGAKYRFYLSCDLGECVVPMPRDAWLAIGERYAGRTADVVLAAATGPGDPVPTAALERISFSPGAVEGALYYWAASTRSIKRAALGADLAVPFIVPGSPMSSYDCNACHSVSRDGSTIAWAVSPLGGEDIAAIQVAPTDMPEAPFVEPPTGTTPFSPELTAGNTTGPTKYFGHNVALSPDGSLAAVNGIPDAPPHWPPFFEIRNAKTGATIDRRALGDPLFGDNLLPIFPEWSPDGKAIAVTLADATGDTLEYGCTWTSETCRSSIAILPFEGGTLGAPEVIVAGGGDWYHFYPSWSPDGKWLTFASAKWNPAVPEQKSLGNRNAVIRLAPVAGGPHTCPGPTCVDLETGMQYSRAMAQSGLGLHSTWPKFAPFALGQGGDLMFIALSSQADYGLVARDLVNKEQSQLWMFAVDVSQMASGDPSYPPIWLPYQDAAEGSLTPLWTATLPCATDPQGGCAGCAPGETCVTKEDQTCFCQAIE